MLKIGSVYKWNYTNYTFATPDDTIYLMFSDSIMTVLDCRIVNSKIHKWQVKLLLNGKIETILIIENHKLSFIEIC